LTDAEDFELKLGRLNHIGVATLTTQFFVTPAKAGGHHRRIKFERRVMDSRFRGNDEVDGVEV
jgi:hypothetical protein